MDLLDIAVTGGMGAAIGAVAVYLALSYGRRAGSTRRREETPVLKAGRMVQREELGKARRELNALLLEKELLSSALTKVYEAEVDKKISRDEREELAARYKKRLKEVGDRLADMEIMIEVGELERLRDELVTLFERKIGEIDNRLQQARVKLERLTLPAKPSEVEVKGKAVEKRRVKAEEVEVDEKVKALRDEVLDALARLEQIDVE